MCNKQHTNLFIISLFICLNNDSYQKVTKGSTNCQQVTEERFASSGCSSKHFFNHLKPTGHVIHQQFKLLKTKRNLLYIRNQFVLHSKHFPTTFIKTSQWVMYKAKFAVCSDIRTKHSTQSEGHITFLNFNPGGT